MRQKTERIISQEEANELLYSLKTLVNAIRENRLLDVRKRYTLSTAHAQAGTAIAKAEGRE